MTDGWNTDGQNGGQQPQDPGARAADPATPHAELYELAAHHPQLRPIIAGNPNTYEGLLEWLGSLGDPAVDAALAQRGDAGAEPAADSAEDQPTQAFEPQTPGAETSAPSAESAQPADDQQTQIMPYAGTAPSAQSAQPAGEQPTQAFPAYGEQQHGYHETEEFSASQEPQQGSQEHFGAGDSSAAAGTAAAYGHDPQGYAPSGYYQYGHPIQQGQQGYYPTAPVPGYDYQEQHQWPGYDQSSGYGYYQQPEEQQEQKKRGGAGVLIFLLLLLVAGGLTAAYFILDPFDRREDTSAAEDQQPGAEEDEDQEPTPSPSPTEEATTDEEEDEEELIEVTPEAPEFDEETGELTIPSIDGVIYLIDGEEITGVYEVDPGQSVTVTVEPEEGYEFPSGTQTRLTFEAAEEEDDEDPERPAPDNAILATSFSAPSGNIHCEISGDEALCTINEHDFDAPSGCSNGVTLRVTREGDSETSCSDEVSQQSRALDYGDAITNDDFACTSDMDGIECWSTQTGNGFFMARESYDLF
ncbi:variant leucine-rich repeat-containing protein [Nesterenkonia flava]|uniref:Leucine rich repeat variant domain-containing protein n=1 Tax=Nesterenkonia flava TaxID=469799 RepID=A0ABU1FUZ9_9MICC|nr:hypothetical protein [Nesterenkonia flava]MDR5712489.1 hypothetical protein [Nesterenkonia flava]